MFVITFITMLVGLADLYKYFPMLFQGSLFDLTWIWEFLEGKLRIGVFLSIIFSTFSDIFASILGPLFGPILNLLRGCFELILHPILFMKTILHAVIGIFSEILYPFYYILSSVLHLVIWVSKLFIHIIHLVFNFPGFIISTTFTIIKSTAIYLFHIFKIIVLAINSVKKFLFPVIEAKATIEGS